MTCVFDLTWARNNDIPLSCLSHLDAKCTLHANEQDITIRGFGRIFGLDSGAAPALKNTNNSTLAPMPLTFKASISSGRDISLNMLNFSTRGAWFDCRFVLHPQLPAVVPGCISAPSAPPPSPCTHTHLSWLTAQTCSTPRRGHCRWSTPARKASPSSCEL